MEIWSCQRLSVHEKDLFIKCVKQWGLTSQILILAEEASELSVACLHSLRKKIKGIHYANNLIEEIADTELMIDEIKYVLELDDRVRRIRERKIERLEEYLKK